MSKIEKIVRNRILQHTIFLSISLYFLLRNFQASSALAPTDYIYTGIFSIFIIVAVYLNLLILIPRLFQEGKYILYFFLLGLFLAIMTYLQIIFFDVIVGYAFPGYYLISYFDYLETMKYFVIMVGISSLLHFSKSWFHYKESQAILVQTQKEKTAAELETLKNQINPHFLFNSLNSIYSLVLKKSNIAPQALIKLSDSMRFIIYESNEEKVLLEKEIAFISDYIELQKLRMSGKDQLEYIIDGNFHDLKIAPLLMIPIIENAFKYGIKGGIEDSFLIINIVVTDNSLTLIVKNNLGTVDNVERTKAKGMGLVNLRKRLELIYPERHHLNIEQLDDTFSVNLKIDL